MKSNQTQSLKYCENQMTYKLKLHFLEYLLFIHEIKISK